MKRLGFIMLALVIALTALGVGYAQWSKTIKIEGSVNTGTVNAVFDGLDILPADALTYGPYQSVSYFVSGNGTDTLQITINDAYPGIVLTIPYMIKNTGTVPVNEVWGDITEVGNGYSGSPINFSVAGTLPVEIGPNASAGGDITITVKNTVESGTNYVITLPIVCTMVPAS